jgi:UDP-glucuronate 4-epimerase
VSTILITGAAGFLGDAIRGELDRLGTPVLPLDRRSQAASGRKTIVCDLTDAHRLHALVHERPIDCIIHSGGVSGPMVARDDPHGIVRANVDGTANLLELARIHGIGRFIFCSSAGVYGATQGGPVVETDPLRPRDTYSASKAAGEHLVAAYAHQFGLDAVSLRFSWIFGPRRATDCVIRTMILDALAGRPTRLPYGRGFPRQFVHVDDAVRAVLAALVRPALPGTAYTISGGSYVSLDEIGGLVRRVLGHADIEVADGPDPGDDYQHSFDISAASRDLGYVPRVTLEDGIRRYADWLADQPNVEITAA